MKQLLNDREVAEFFGVGRGTIWAWSRNGILPPPVAIGPRVKRWRISDLQAVVDNAPRASESAA